MRRNQKKDAQMTGRLSCFFIILSCFQSWLDLGVGSFGKMYLQKVPMNQRFLKMILRPELVLDCRSNLQNWAHSLLNFFRVKTLLPHNHLPWERRIKRKKRHDTSQAGTKVLAVEGQMPLPPPQNPPPPPKVLNPLPLPGGHTNLKGSLCLIDTDVVPEMITFAGSPQ